MNKNKPVRLHKKEPLAIEYELRTVILTGTIFIIILFLIAFVLGSDNFNFMLGRII